MTTAKASARTGTRAMPPALGVPTAPPLPEDVEALLRRLRLPHIRHIRRHAPEVVATAKAQRWEPVEVLRRSWVRRPSAGNVPRSQPGEQPPGSRPGRRSKPGRPRRPRSRPRPNRPCGPWSGSDAERTSSCVGHQGPGRRSCSRHWVSKPSRPGLVDAAYEKRSVAISSNLHPAAFDELMPKTLATATVDRLLHHAHICQTTGESVRLIQALAGQGVSPLS